MSPDVIPAGVRFWMAVTVFAAAAAAVFGVSTDDSVAGTVVLAFLATAALLLMLLHVGVSDGTVTAGRAEAGPGDEGAEAAPEAPARPGRHPVPPTAPALWPVLGALAGGIVLVGLVAGAALVAIGLALALVVVAEWMVQGWAEHATPDPEENRQLRNRIMYPFEIPAVAVVGVLVVVVLFSRVLLALPRTGSTAVAIVVAGVILGVASLIATRPRISSGLVTSAVVLGAAALIGGGIAGAVVGEREFEPHEEEAHGDVDVREVELVARDISFLQTEIEAAPGETIEITYENEDEGIPHNLAFTDLPDTPATAIEQGPVTQTLTISTPEAGEFTYICEVHPTQMVGTLVVSE